jgi:hypothetical protein
MADHIPIHVSREMHKAIRVMAAEQEITMRALVEKLLRLGIVAQAQERDDGQVMTWAGRTARGEGDDD